MNTQERLLIRDHLSRKRYCYLVGFILHFSLMTMSWWVKPVSLIGLVFCGSLLLLIGGTGLARTLLSMPVTASQLARSWRFVAFTFPALAAMAILGISAVIAAWSSAPQLDFGGFVIIALLQALTLGTMLLMLTVLPTGFGPANSIGKRIGMVGFGLLWGLIVPAFLVFSQKIPRKWEEIGSTHLAVGLLLVAATVSGILRTDRLVTGRMVRADAESHRHLKTGRASVTTREGFGELPYLLLRSGISPLAIVVMTMVLFWIIERVMQDSPVTSSSSIPISFFAPLISLSTSQFLLSQLRILRTLPLGRVKLTHLLVFWPLLLVAISLAAGEVMNLLLFDIPFGTDNWILSLTTPIMIGMLLPLFLRFGMRFWLIGAVIFPAVFISALWGRHVAEFQDSVLWFVALIAGMAVLAGGWFACYRLLGSPYPWRAGALRWSAQGSKLG